MGTAVPMENAWEVPRWDYRRTVPGARSDRRVDLQKVEPLTCATGSTSVPSMSSPLNQANQMAGIVRVFYGNADPLSLFNGTPASAGELGAAKPITRVSTTVGHRLIQQLKRQLRNVCSVDASATLRSTRGWTHVAPHEEIFVFINLVRTF